ncbi:hypothetical protein MC7420_1402 [Coleofasciculus chthonoplastes PCC 7420]|uniref:Uncharacterized protein n=1 Tax=Coleofasciculus chthonoplastes PCC 7420 TaxID=118168 RepID=B4VRU8_9CYAN|nr:hypothetical protein MC7420_1402 [Coleofasciculus chthonoplastes PCC 7420]
MPWHVSTLLPLLTHFPIRQNPPWDRVDCYSTRRMRSRLDCL